MPHLLYLLTLLLLLIPNLALAGEAQMTPVPKPAVPVVSPLNLAPMAAELGQKIQALVTGEEEVEPEETFGTRALGMLLGFFETAREEGGEIISNFAALPQISAWISQQFNDPFLHDRWLLIGENVLIVAGGAFAIAWLSDLLTLPLRRRLVRRQTVTWNARLATVFSWLLLALVPVVLFVGTALVLLDQQNPPKLVRFVVMTVVYALAVLRLVRLVARFFLAPYAANLRLIPISSPQAVYLTRWISWLGFVIVGGYFFVDFARLLKVPTMAVTAFSNLVGLAVVLMAITIISQKRVFISAFLRGSMLGHPYGVSLWQSLRLWLSRTWYGLAIGYLVIGYIVTSHGSGFALMLQGTILTLLTLVGMWLGFSLVGRLSRKIPREGWVGATLHRRVLQFVLRLVVWILGILGVAASWGVDVGALFDTAWGQRILGSGFSILATLIVVALVYETMQNAIARQLHRRDAEGRVVEVNPRARTLLPMISNAVLIILIVIVGLVTLSELGINIAPLLAGAGVLGVAVGFGSQTLIKDFLTGLFIILEDAIAVGDVVSIGDHSGKVENITIRTVRLRDAFGNLHILPFSEINKLVNKTKDFAYAVMDLNVAYTNDLPRVMQVMREIGLSLQDDPALKPLILEPIEVIGIEKFAENSITLRARIKTQPGKQWDVQRAYMYHIKDRFGYERLPAPAPTVMQLEG